MEVVPPTNPPAYVGLLRTSSSSVNSTVETMNCMDADGRADGLAGPPTSAAARAWISAGPCVGIDFEGFAVCGCRVVGGRRRRRSGTRSERSGDLGLAVRTIATAARPRVRMTASATIDRPPAWRGREGLGVRTQRRPSSRALTDRGRRAIVVEMRFPRISERVGLVDVGRTSVHLRGRAAVLT
jgi:hypothetical protein